ncbi:MAG: hypothetical protein Q9227_002638 [Pyrenula ochraceoflavens]
MALIISVLAFSIVQALPSSRSVPNVLSHPFRRISHVPRASSNSSSVSPYYGYAEAAFDTLQTWYSNGNWQTTMWWNAANCLTVCADLQAVDGNRQSEMDQLFPQVYSDNIYAQDGNFLNNYYDDEGWWALAWIAVYDVTKNNTYLSMAQSIFDDMDKGWSANCTGGGGITGGMWWSKKPDTAAGLYVNAIANELYISVAGHLANRASGPYKDKAIHAWTWLSGSGMINSTGLFNDGLTHSCSNNGDNGWTYNQGVIVGGLVEIAQATGDVAYLNSARAIANAAIQQNQEDSGPILREQCEPNCNDDNSQQFKGPFMRNLAILYAATREDQYKNFITKNADSIWNSDRDSQGMGAASNQLGESWSSFVPIPNAVTHNSAMAALVAAIKVTSQ